MKNKLTTISIIVVAIVFLGVMFWFGRPGSRGSNESANISDTISANDLSVEESAFDFGRISMAAGKVAHDFKVKNAGAEPVMIEKLYTSCMCTIAVLIQNGKSSGPYGMPGHGFVPPLKKSIAPGEEVTISVTFDPAVHGPAGIGPVKRVIYLEGDDVLLQKLMIEAVVIP